MVETIKIFCPRCGSEMDIRARNCLKCGYINPDHPDNKNMQKYIKNNVESYSIGSGQSILNKKNGEYVNLTTVGRNTGSKRLCFWVNIVIYLIFVFGIGIYMFLKTGCLLGAISSRLYIYIIFASILMFIFYSIELVYMKMNKKWWSSLIPIYSSMELSDAVLKSSLLGLLVYIPVIGQIFSLYLLFKLGVAFKKSGFLTMLFPFVMIPVIGFGSSFFEGHNYVDEEKYASEKDYKRTKFFLITISICFIAAMAMFVYNNFTDIRNHHRSLSRTYYVSIAKKIVKDTEWSFRHNRYSCSNNIKSNQYVFYYSDIGDQFNIPFSLYNDVLSGYVIMERNGEDNYNYYVSLTDGDRGIPEVNIDNLSVDSVVDFKKLDQKYEYGLKCVIK